MNWFPEETEELITRGGGGRGAGGGWRASQAQETECAKASLVIRRRIVHAMN